MKERTSLGRVIWRSFFLQASWNYQGQQNLGVASALEPALRKIHGPETPERVAAAQRSLDPFNTQPFMAGPVLGLLIRGEEMLADGEMPAERLARLKGALSTAFAAIGDTFFWNAVLPMAATVGLFWAVWGSPVGAAVFLLLFNFFHLVFRVWGTFWGYRAGFDITRLVDRLGLPRQALRLRVVLTAALGGLAACFLAIELGRSGFPKWTMVLGLGGAPAVFLFSSLIKKGLPVEFLVYGLGAALVLTSSLVH